MIKQIIRNMAWMGIPRIRSGVGAGLRFRAVGSGLAYALGTNEQPVQEALSRLLKPGSVFYDIGANVGFFSMIGARLVGATGHVYAFEPVPRHAETIRQNARRNGFRHVTVFEKAVSDTSGPEALRLTRHPGGATLISTGIIPGDATCTTIAERIVLDEWIASCELGPPDVVKIDVEGAELAVLKGMLSTLQVHAPVLVYEIDDTEADRFAQRRVQLDAFVEAYGYRVTHLENAYPGAGSHVGHAVATPI